MAKYADDSHLIGLTPDIYGQVHPNESDEFIQAKLDAFDAAVESLEDTDKEYLERAQQNSEREFRLMFLRCELFLVEPAVKRYLTYWNRRVEIFGVDKAFQPLTLKGALKDDHKTVKRGIFTLMPSKDPKGRSIVFMDPSLQDTRTYPRESVVRSFWHLLHVALEDTDTQKHGILVIGWPYRAKFSQFDKKLAKANAAAIRGAIPVRVAGIHMCQTPSFISIILPIIKIFMGERLRKRINIHSGSLKHVHQGLAKFDITPDLLPSELGGPITLDRDAWFHARLASEKL